MRVLVRGGAGNIGAHACKELKNKGYEPVVFDNLVCGHKDFDRWGRHLTHRRLRPRLKVWREIGSFYVDKQKQA